MAVSRRLRTFLALVAVSIGFTVFTEASFAPQQPRTIWSALYGKQAEPGRNLVETLLDDWKRRLSGRWSATMPVRFQHWHEMALTMAGVDHTPPSDGETRPYAEHYGPGRASRAMAVVHLAMFEVVNAFDGRYESYVGVRPVLPLISMEAALAQAAHDTLHALYSGQSALCDQHLAEDLKSIPDGPRKRLGIAFGRQVAAAVSRGRADDGSDHSDPLLGTEFITSDDPGKWRQDPVSQLPMALGAYWGDVRPFVIGSATGFRVPPPPSMESAEYAAAYEEVKRFGGDGVVTPTARTPDQTIAAIYWAYDGTPSLCAPPRLFNQIAMTIADQMGSDLLETARLLALVNLAMADTAIAVWESKYYYQFWRPVIGIREADEGTGPTGLGDGNPLTVGDPGFSPLGSPASNLNGPNFTPPFPAYPSGHAAFGGAVFQMLRNFYRTDNIAFTFVSDELNGETKDNSGEVRPYLPRTFWSLSEAEEESGQSRIYLGVHWSFDKTAGIEQGRRIANDVFRNAFGPSTFKAW